MADFTVALVDGGGVDHVLGQIDDHRAGAAAARHVERLMDRTRQVRHILHQIAMLGAGPGDADDVGLLKGVVADQMGRHLAGQADHRNTVHHGVGETGDAVGGARTRGHQNDADLAGRTRVTLGRVNRRLLVAHQHMTQFILFEDGVIDRKYSAAGITEYEIDALVDQSLE